MCACSNLYFYCRERPEKSLLTWERVEECAIETGIVDKLEVIFLSVFSIGLYIEYVFFAEAEMYSEKKPERNFCSAFL